MSKIDEYLEATWKEAIELDDCNITKDVISEVCYYLGANLFKADARLVTFSDPKELNYVKDQFVKAKLAVLDSDVNILSVIRFIGQKYHTNQRALVYALLMDYYDVTSIKK